MTSLAHGHADGKGKTGLRQPPKKCCVLTRRYPTNRTDTAKSKELQIMLQTNFRATHHKN
ncbi:hypothetical protein OLMES_1535 [Oleiphilus messinensis]|uniref:Uncharacterized protein n=1 Tax=Oleiphilus messinensis TaxID=141451 RepID=A0A1Y0I5T9_9GAMM|nr:hypothetical protein OLMES_1535 [Oleiphilus messinensis]